MDFYTKVKSREAGDFYTKITKSTKDGTSTRGMPRIEVQLQQHYGTTDQRKRRHRCQSTKFLPGCEVGEMIPPWFLVRLTRIKSESGWTPVKFSPGAYQRGGQKEIIFRFRRASDRFGSGWGGRDRCRAGRRGQARGKEREGVFGGWEPLHRNKPHFTGLFFKASRYKAVTKPEPGRNQKGGKWGGAKENAEPLGCSFFNCLKI